MDFNVKGIDLNHIKEEFNRINSAEFWGIEINVSIYIINSKYKRFIYERDIFYKNTEYPGDNSFRAFYQPVTNEIFIFVDKYENTTSLIWLIIHELTHHAIINNKILYQFAIFKLEECLKEKFNLTLEEYYNNSKLNTLDDVHEENPEKKICNDVANTLMKECYDLKWWRHRIENNKTRHTFS